MLPNGRSIGVHLPLGPGMVRAADRAQEIGATAIQVFADNPTSWRRRSRAPSELPAFRTRVTEIGLDPLVIHAAYLINLAGPDDEFFARSVTALVAELRAGCDYRARYVNVHTGSHRGDGFEAGARRIAVGAHAALASLPDSGHRPRLVFENSAGGGFGIGTTLAQLGLIADSLNEAHVDPEQVGFCLDTAHLWGAGYAIDTTHAVDELLAGFDSRIGLDRLVLVHLNDSRAALGSRQDHHEHLGAGAIGPDGLGRFLTHPGLDHVAYILETPGTDDGYDVVNLRRAHDLVAGRALDPMPAEAFHVRSPRGRSAPAEEDGEDGPDGTPAAAASRDGAADSPADGHRPTPGSVRAAAANG